MLRLFARPSVLLIVLSFFCSLGMASALPPASEAQESPRESAIGKTSLTVFHVNDWHGSIAPSSASWMNRSAPPALGGPAALSSMLRRLKLETLRGGGRYLVLDAGDRFQGSLEVNMSRGRLMTDLWNALGVTFATLGNHDFDYGQEPLAALLRDGRFVTLCANIRASSVSSTSQALPGLTWAPSRVFEIAGVRVGLFGLITDQLPTLSYPEHLSGLVLEPAVNAARREIARLRNARADLIILLSHCGHDVDCALASEAPGIDLIVGGHTDDHLLQPKRIDSTLIVQTRGFGSHLGALRLDLAGVPPQSEASLHGGRTWTIASFSYQNLVIDPRFDPPDPVIESIIASHGRALAGEVDRPIATLSIALPKRGGTGESDFGALICRTICEATNIPVAFFQAGGIRADLPAGMVRFRHLYQALPFEHFVVTGELRGSDLIELAKEGQRLAHQGLSGTPDHLVYAGTPVASDTWYPVAFNDFLAMGGDSFPAFRRARNVQRRQETVRGLLLEHLEKR